MRPVEHSDVVEIHIFIAQFQDSLRDELGLLASIIKCDQRRLHGVGLARWAQMFAELLNVRGDGSVRDFQNFWDAAVIHLDLENLRIRIAFWKFENVLKT